MTTLKVIREGLDNHSDSHQIKFPGTLALCIFRNSGVDIRWSYERFAMSDHEFPWPKGNLV